MWQMGSEWWERVFHDGALEAKGAAWALVSLTLRSNRTGEEVVWIATLRRLQVVMIGHAPLCRGLNSHRNDIDNVESM